VVQWVVIVNITPGFNDKSNANHMFIRISSFIHVATLTRYIAAFITKR
jgi:hypothetical protein